MRTRRLESSAILLLVLGCLAASPAEATSGGAPPLTTGGGFPGERDCTACHEGGAPNSGGGELAVEIEGSPASDFRYTPGRSATILVRAVDRDASRIGFQLTIRSADGCGQPGGLAAGATVSGSLVNVVSGDCPTSLGQVQWATHRRPQTGSEAEFQIVWTPPEQSVGPVSLAVAVNGADGDASPAGDRIYTRQATIRSATDPVAPPLISQGGVTLADLFSATRTGAPNALATIRGEHFASPGTASDADLDELGNVAEVLDGVCVEVNGQRAPVLRLQPDLINFQVPYDSALGDATVRVWRACDTPVEEPSNLVGFEIAEVRPVFFLFSETPPVGAIHSDSALVAELGAVPGWRSRPAVAGDIITFIGTGFGAVEPALHSGELPTDPRPLAASSVTPMIGGVELGRRNIFYIGAASNLAGLYQISVVVPDTVPEGTHDFAVVVDGVPSAPGPELVIGSPGSEGSACANDLILLPGTGCSGEIRGIDVAFDVDESGGACFSAPTLGLNICGTEEIDLSLYGISLERNEDGSWTIVELP